MKLSCIHCGQLFTTKAEHLGGSVECPHCHHEVVLPEAEDHESADQPHRGEPTHWLRNCGSGLISLILHMALMLLLALVTYGAYSGEGLEEDVLIGTLPSAVLHDSQVEEFDATEEIESSSELEELDEMLEAPSPTAATEDGGFDVDISASSLAAAVGSEGASFDLNVGSAGGGMAGGSWEGLLQSLRRNGLDIVITFDSTGSMGGEIRQVKEQIQRIGATLVKLVPKARISICTYRDDSDRARSYVVKGIPLTSNIDEVEQFLAGVNAGGGGDRPEAVHEGLKWSVENNDFRPRARKVILVFGDAPPHSHHQAKCLSIASDFHRYQKGVVSTVTCRSTRRLSEFAEIAEMGGGESFLTSDEQQIMTQLMVLVFGSQYRSKVVEAFRLMGE
jgi:Mg-chelatase subunit ChlD/DNA-directed RNA polymerase subunit RPC12/RpoP